MKNKYISDLPTPSFLIDLDILENNVKRFQGVANKNNTDLWPMQKTHKSTYITELQLKNGAKGVLCGTLDEAEIIASKFNAVNIMLAYPVISNSNLARVIKLNKISNLLISVDNIAQAKRLALLTKDTFNYLIIYNSGLNRLGVESQEVLKLKDEIDSMENFNFYGVATHTGQVYGVSNKEEVRNISSLEMEKTNHVIKNLALNEISPKIVATGTTPTFNHVVTSTSINSSRPGNYVFMDAIQVALGEDINNCALTVTASIISKPRDDLFIIDSGSKCLGLDKGAHGNSSIVGYGLIKDHPELVITSLSEEVGKVEIKKDTHLKVGDIIEIIPNHSCSAANMTSNFIGHRNGRIEKIIEVDMRSNSKLNTHL